MAGKPIQPALGRLVGLSEERAQIAFGHGLSHGLIRQRTGPFSIVRSATGPQVKNGGDPCRTLGRRFGKRWVHTLTSSNLVSSASLTRQNMSNQMRPGLLGREGRRGYGLRSDGSGEDSSVVAGWPGRGKWQIRPQARPASCSPG